MVDTNVPETPPLGGIHRTLTVKLTVIAFICSDTQLWTASVYSFMVLISESAQFYTTSFLAVTWAMPNQRVEDRSAGYAANQFLVTYDTERTIFTDDVRRYFRNCYIR